VQDDKLCTYRTQNEKETWKDQGADGSSFKTYWCRKVLIFLSYFVGRM